MTRLLLAVPALLAIAALSGAVGPPAPARADEPTPAADTLDVTGVGSVSATPDEAQLTFGVETRGATARAALAANGSAMRKVIAALRDAGARELSTQWVSVWPISREEGAIEGYTASNSVSATIGVERAGGLIDAAVGAGANQISGPSLSSADARSLYRKALADAVADARDRAEALVEATGRTLGRIISVEEVGTQPGPYYPTAAADAASTPIVPGQQETTATVSVTFALR